MAFKKWQSGCDAGKMSKRITIKQLTTGQNEYGEPSTTWNTVKTVWASIEPLSGKAFWEAEAVQSEITHKIITRASGITPDMKIYYGARIFDIDSVINENEQGAKYIIMAKEVIL